MKMLLDISVRRVEADIEIRLLVPSTILRDASLGVDVTEASPEVLEDARTTTKDQRHVIDRLAAEVVRLEAELETLRRCSFGVEHE